MKKMMILTVFALLAFACDNDDDTIDDIIDSKVYIYDFDDGAEGWSGDYSDFPVSEEDSLGLTFEPSGLPEPLNVDEGSLMITGAGGGENLFLYTKKKITDLEPNTTYQVTFKVTLAATVDTTGTGVANNNVEMHVKAGVALEEPVTGEDETGYNRFTGIDKGDIGQNGANAVVLKSFTGDTLWDNWALDTVSNDTPVEITTDENGEAWAFVGTETVAGDVTTVYYDKIEVDFD